VRAAASAFRAALLQEVLCVLSVLCGFRFAVRYFLNKFSNACRASFGRRLAGVDVSFSRVTRISNNLHSFRASFFAIRSGMGCIHSNRLPGSKYVHCLHECNSNPHFGHFSPEGIPCKTVPHCVHRETARVPGRFTGLGPKVLSRFGGAAPPDFSPDPLRDS
jgi:hypothetical protein